MLQFRISKKRDRWAELSAGEVRQIEGDNGFLRGCVQSVCDLSRVDGEARVLIQFGVGV
jgi:hypothetical protein